MKTLFKIIYRISLLFIVLILLTVLLVRFIPLEYAKPAYENYFDILFFGGIPAAILLLISRIGYAPMDSKQKKQTIIKYFLLSVGCFFIFFLYALLSWSDGMCRYNTIRTLYTHRTVPSTHIILRGYGCGAVDGGPPNISTAKLRTCTPLFNYISPIDTSKIKKEEWIRVEEK